MITVFQIILAIISGVVAGLIYYTRKAPWMWIFAYWLTLMVKNIWELVR